MSQLNITQLLGIFHLQQIFEGDVQNPQRTFTNPCTMAIFCQPVQPRLSLRLSVALTFTFNANSCCTSAVAHFLDTSMMYSYELEDTTDLGHVRANIIPNGK